MEPAVQLAPIGGQSTCTRTSGNNRVSCNDQSIRLSNQYQQEHQHKQQQRNGSQQANGRFKRHRTSDSCLGKLIALLDLRFADKDIERDYCQYYAQVKRHLLPTAIKVVLLMNLLQMLDPYLRHYLATQESLPSSHNQQQSLANTIRANNDQTSHTLWQQQNHNDRPFNPTTSRQLPSFRSLILPLALQIVILVATFAMLKYVCAELDPRRGEQRRLSSSASEQNGNSRRKTSRHKRRHKSSSGPNDSLSLQPASSSPIGSTSGPLSSSDSDDDQVPLSDQQHADSSGLSSADEAEQLSAGKRDNESGGRRRRHRSSTKPDSRLSAGSGLSASLSLTFEQPTMGIDRSSGAAKNPRKNSKKATDLGDSDNSSTSSRASSSTSAKKLRLIEKRSSKNEIPKGTKHLRNSYWRRSSSQANKLSRFKLSVPYLLWLCQLLQLASSLWLQQPFISYSTLLLFIYTDYSIFPVRPMSCFMLALGLSITQPLIEYLLQLNIQVTLSPPPMRQSGAHDLMDANSSSPSPSSPLGAYDYSTKEPPESAKRSASSPTALIPMEPSPFSKDKELWARMLLTSGVNIIGIMSLFFYERQQRGAYLETRQSCETKRILEQESKEQERLLLSILPKHLASAIRKDLGAVVTGQFKKIYMSRHENVSILFADIVGFTAISSHCPAAELVKTLNELFARFDKLAEKYHQLRIKILGDCYYAISGAPIERPDHAVLCVHMGLSMVDAIRSVRERTKSTVDMRVGVHTGRVLAGVLGQRQWQFDVYSKDVELANKMESSGLPGRVHISSATLRFLNDEFQVSDGDGASREEALRLAGIKTYFIDRVKKPYPEGTLDAPQKQQSPRSTGQQVAASDPAFSSEASAVIQPQAKPLHLLKMAPNKQAVTGNSNNNDNDNDTNNATSGSNEKQQPNNQIRPLSLNFSNRQFERQFRSTSDVASCVSLIGLPITLLCAFVAYLYLYKVQTQVTIVYASNFLVLLGLVLVCILPHLWQRPVANGPVSSGQMQMSRQQCLAKAARSVAEAVKQSAWMKLALTAFMTFIWLVAHSVAIQQTSSNLDQITNSRALQLFTVDLFNYFAITCTLAITAISRISFLVKTIVIIIVILLQVIMNMTLLSDLLTKNLVPSTSSLSPSESYRATAENLVDSYQYDQYIFTLTLIAIGWALSLINRQFELTNRRLFLWRKQVEERKEKVADMRRKNEALVYNILPPNVAKIFLGKRNINDEELYSKSYEAVGVLFAAMPNFSDFYTEESVNNQGLECLRFLNEVISDYDALLDQARFKNIIKIKTMGSTYMAASGLYEGDALEDASGSATCSQKLASPSTGIAVEGGGDRLSLNSTASGDTTRVRVSKQAGADSVDEIRAKWGHLEQLTEFALALKDTLNNINKESFNNFVLRIGINQGPITAGVIGVKKPHFDMWGNTVNVASRMESTGRAGSIQVVEETATILRHFGFQFDPRGLVSVKGKGKLMTFYLTGKAASLTQQQPQHSAASGISGQPSSSSPAQSGSVQPSATIQQQLAGSPTAQQTQTAQQIQQQQQPQWTHPDCHVAI